MTLIAGSSGRVAVPAGLTIRDFAYSDADYAAAVDVNNAVYFEYPESVEDWKFADAHRPAHLKQRRWLVELDGRAVGFASYSQHENMYNPRLFHFSAAVRPELQGQGIGRALYDTALDALTPFTPNRIRARTRSDWARAMRFLQRLGFVEDMRDWESRLEVGAFDPTPYAGHEARVTAGGIRLVTAQELMATDLNYRRKLYELDVDLTQDVPHPEPQTSFSYETFEHYVFKSPDFLPDAYVVAVEGDRYAGMSALWKADSEPGTLYTGLTGVRRAYRRRGIALALKLRAIAYARQHGITTLKTWNESNNRPMLSINEQLGFVKQPAWVSFVSSQ